MQIDAQLSALLNEFATILMRETSWDDDLPKRREPRFMIARIIVAGVSWWAAFPITSQFIFAARRKSKSLLGCRIISSSLPPSNDQEQSSCHYSKGCRIRISWSRCTFVDSRVELYLPALGINLRSAFLVISVGQGSLGSVYRPGTQH